MLQKICIYVPNYFTKTFKYYCIWIVLLPVFSITSMHTLHNKVWDYFHLFYTVCFQNLTAVWQFWACGSLLKLFVKPLLPVIRFLALHVHCWSKCQLGSRCIYTRCKVRRGNNVVLSTLINFPNSTPHSAFIPGLQHDPNSPIMQVRRWNSVAISTVNPRRDFNVDPICKIERLFNVD